ncbi:BON domain-containing protein [bacterium]|nr:BON domain-containing protein [bacterium]
MHRILSALGIAALLGGATVLLTACADQGTSRPGPKLAMRALGEDVIVPTEVSDETIGAEVRRRLNLADPARTAGVIVEVRAQRVLLRGVAPTLAAAWRAEAAARSTPGVAAVRNEILIQP